jgi:trehalose monomycolate/heme transporter
MLERLGHLMYTRRRWVLALAGLFVVVAAVWGTSVFGRLVGGGFNDPSADSSKAVTVADAAFGRSAADVVVLYSSTTRTVDDPAFSSAVYQTLARLPKADVAAVITARQNPAMISADRHTTYVVLQLVGANDAQRQTSYDAIKDQLSAPGLTTLRGGAVAVNEAINQQVTADIGKAEGISTPILIGLLVLVFGGLAAASLPLAIGGLAILGAFTALRVISIFTDVSVFAINIVTMLGLGLAIDYGLFVVSRFREELAARGGEREAVHPAIVATMRTAGRTVLFSGLTVAIALSSLMLFDLPFLRSMGYGGVAAVLVAMTGALTVLPALLSVLGPRVNALHVPLPRFSRRRSHVPQQADTAASMAPTALMAPTASATAVGPTDPAAPVAAPAAQVAGSGAWYRIATSVMKRPVAYVVAITVVLLAMGLPFLHVQWGNPDHRALPVGAEARTAGEQLTRLFPDSGTSPIDAVITLNRPAAAAGPDLAAYAQRLRAVPGVTAATVTGLAGNHARISLAYTPDPTSTAGRALVGSVRAVTPPPGGQVLVGGFSATNADTLSAIGRTLPWAALWIVGGMLVLLFLAFGSAVLPFKAVLMNMLSLSASFGAVVWIFQEGHLSGVLGFTSVGSVEATQPVLMFAIAFGLAMDYEVFLLSRVREEWDRTGDNTAAVAIGLQRTGRIITSAAALLIVVIGSFATSGVTFIKMIGVGVALAILVDATVVRALLVPATMRLLGRVNWWAPPPLARVYARVGLRESGPAATAQGAGTADAAAEMGRPDAAYVTMEG